MNFGEVGKNKGAFARKFNLKSSDSIAAKALFWDEIRNQNNEGVMV